LCLIVCGNLCSGNNANWICFHRRRTLRAGLLFIMAHAHIMHPVSVRHFVTVWSPGFSMNLCAAATSEREPEGSLLSGSVRMRPICPSLGRATTSLRKLSNPSFASTATPGSAKSSSCAGA
jgi:hypothetical protein